MSVFRVELLSRPGCGLCLDAEPTVRRAAAFFRAEMETIDLSKNIDLETEYGLRIPVVRDGYGVTLAEGRVEALSLFLALLAAWFRCLLRR